jgi:hypothetical protein
MQLVGSPAVVALLLTTAGCGSDEGDEGATAGDGSVNCSPRCESKLSSCGAPTDTVTAWCSDLCAQSPDESEMTCLEGYDCNDLGSGYPCGIYD